ncbi:MAG: TetR/AcrR family transcriptional regulator [Bacteroidota bacterium]
MKEKISVRDRLINTAADLFYDKGYNNTGINEVIDKAEVAKASMYAHFRTKEDLCIAYLQKMEGHFNTLLKDRVENADEGKAKVLAVFDYLGEFFTTKEFRGCWCINTMSEIPKDNQVIRSEIVKQKNGLKAYIQKIIEENLTVADSQTLARKIYLLYEGAVAESYLHQEDWPIVEARQMAELLL